MHVPYNTHLRYGWKCVDVSLFFMCSQFPGCVLAFCFAIIFSIPFLCGPAVCQFPPIFFMKRNASDRCFVQTAVCNVDGVLMVIDSASFDDPCIVF